MTPAQPPRTPEGYEWAEGTPRIASDGTNQGFDGLDYADPYNSHSPVYLRKKVQPPHPQRCLTCDSCGNAEKTNSKTYPVKCLISKPVPMMVHEYCISWFGYVGCASHTSASSQRIDAISVSDLTQDEITHILFKLMECRCDTCKSISHKVGTALLQAGDQHE